MATPASNPIPKTVFIIGAGASQEARMPYGSELKNSIAGVLDIRFGELGKRVRGDQRIYEALEMSTGSNDINIFLRAARRICDVMPQAISIDHFLDSHSDDKQIELCGKLAIVRTILEAEAKSSLFVELQGKYTLDFSYLQQTWFNSFMQRVTENCRFADLGTRLKSVALIIFNYDRCVEYYLYHAIQNYYGIEASDIAPLLQRLEIYHPYGMVGSLPWCTGKNAIAFGATPNSKQLLTLASQIKTFSEITDDSSEEVTSIRSIMRTSHKLVFLGFAFHRMNINLLLPDTTSPKRYKDKRVFATARGLSDNDTVSITDELESRGQIVRDNIHIDNRLKCTELFYEHMRSLSFA
jgi:hypothetical protein